MIIDLLFDVIDFPNDYRANGYSNLVTKFVRSFQWI